MRLATGIAVRRGKIVDATHNEHPNSVLRRSSCSAIECTDTHMSQSDINVECKPSLPLGITIRRGWLEILGFGIATEELLASLG